MNKMEDKDIIDLSLSIIGDITELKRQVRNESATRKYLKKRVSELHSMESLSRENTKSLYNLVSNIYHSYSRYNPETTSDYISELAVLGDIKDQLIDRLDIEETIEVEEV